MPRSLGRQLQVITLLREVVHDDDGIGLRQSASRVQRKIHDEVESPQQLQQARGHPVEFVAARNEQVGIGSFARAINGALDTLVHGLISILVSGRYRPRNAELVSIDWTCLSTEVTYTPVKKNYYVSIFFN